MNRTLPGCRHTSARSTSSSCLRLSAEEDGTLTRGLKKVVPKAVEERHAGTITAALSSALVPFLGLVRVHPDRQLMDGGRARYRRGTKLIGVPSSALRCLRDPTP